jgi:hypothetical protein
MLQREECSHPVQLGAGRGDLLDAELTKLGLELSELLCQIILVLAPERTSLDLARRLQPVSDLSVPYSCLACVVISKKWPRLESGKTIVYVFCVLWSMKSSKDLTAHETLTKQADNYRNRGRGLFVLTILNSFEVVCEVVSTRCWEDICLKLSVSRYRCRAQVKKFRALGRQWGNLLHKEF